MIACRAEEIWTGEDGAPAGPGFDFLIASSRTPRRPYRIVRDERHPKILHVPRCEAWYHGHRLCRHVREAIVRAEQPDLTFREAVAALYATSAWWASPVDAHALCGAVKRLLDEARNQRERNAAGERSRAASDAFHALPAGERAARAVAEFS